MEKERERETERWEEGRKRNQTQLQNTHVLPARLEYFFPKLNTS